MLFGLGSGPNQRPKRFAIHTANQQVTKALSKRVGTSETLRPLTKLNRCKFAVKFSPKLYYNKMKIINFGTPIMDSKKPNKTNTGSGHFVTKEGPTNSFNEYLAGLIDGDGCLLLNSKNYASLEITMDISDEHALNKIKQKLGGSVKLRTGGYRLHHKKGMLNLISRINGLIRNSKRASQLKKLWP